MNVVVGASAMVKWNWAILFWPQVPSPTPKLPVAATVVSALVVVLSMLCAPGVTAPIGTASDGAVRVKSSRLAQRLAPLPLLMSPGCTSIRLSPSLRKRFGMPIAATSSPPTP